MIHIELNGKENSLAHLIDAYIKCGETVVLNRNGEPVAQLSHYPLRDRKMGKHTNRLNFLDKEITIPDDWDEWSDEEARALGIID